MHACKHMSTVWSKVVEDIYRNDKMIRDDLIVCESNQDASHILKMCVCVCAYLLGLCASLISSAAPLQHSTA